MKSSDIFYRFRYTFGSHPVSHAKPKLIKDKALANLLFARLNKGRSQTEISLMVKIETSVVGKSKLR